MYFNPLKSLFDAEGHAKGKQFTLAPHDVSIAELSA